MSSLSEGGKDRKSLSGHKICHLNHHFLRKRPLRIICWWKPTSAFFGTVDWPLRGTELFKIGTGMRKVSSKGTGIQFVPIIVFRRELWWTYIFLPLGKCKNLVIQEKTNHFNSAWLQSMWNFCFGFPCGWLFTPVMWEMGSRYRVTVSDLCSPNSVFPFNKTHTKGHLCMSTHWLFSRSWLPHSTV